MLRHSSPVERVLTYATFLSLSLALHMVAVLGTRAPQSPPAPDAHGVAATSSRTAGASAADPAARATSLAQEARPQRARGRRDG
ncbi:MAG: hypothetical protein AB7N76_20995 [Planctomycetota bacterium]